jgi:hypothetical protein
MTQPKTNMRFTLRLVTIFCYFLPFTFFLSTCNNLTDIRFPYNQKEADSNLLNAQQFESPTYNSTQIENDTTSLIQASIIAQKNSSDTTQVIQASTDTTSSLSDKLIQKILFPTKTSLSGIGSVFYFKNLTGKIAIALNLIISLILLAAFKILKSTKTKLYLLSAGVLCLVIFIIDSYISHVTLLYGIWILFTLLLLQLKNEITDRNKAYP